MAFDAKAYAREWKRQKRQNDPDFTKRYQSTTNQKQRWADSHGRRYRLKTKYGMTLESYNKLYAEQNGLCAICRQPETAVRRGKLCLLAVDHDHITGHTRGLLCSRCNPALGQFQEDVLTLEAAIEYLKKYRGQYGGN